MADANNLQAQINGYWDARGTTYDTQPGHEVTTAEERAAWATALAALLPPASADVLDVGTGTGFLAFLLAELGHRVTGIDLAEGMLDVARGKATPLARPPVFARGDAIDPLFPEGGFDVVISRHLLWTLTDLPRAFGNWHRLLRPGGRLLAIDALWWSETRPDPADRADTEDSWRALFAASYGPEVRARLPLLSATTLDPVLDAARAAGFGTVRTEQLAEVERIERATNPSRTAALRYVVVARRDA